MMGTITPLLYVAALLTVFVIGRLILVVISASGEANKQRAETLLYGSAQTTGNQVIQADCVQVSTNHAGMMAVMADGIGKENTGKLCAQIAVDTLLDWYEPYHMLKNPECFFRTSFYEANLRIQKTIGERRGGACLAAVFLNENTLYYALAGDIRIALLRGEELIPISKGHTMDVLALHAYEKGRISKKETVWSMEEKRTWNYLGMDGFHDIEIAERPIRLKVGDQIFVITKGIWQELSWAEMEDILLRAVDVQEKAN